MQVPVQPQFQTAIVLALALLATVLVWRVAAAWQRHIDPAALRAARSLGVGAGRRFRHLVLPRLARALAADLLLAGLAAAVALLLFD